MQGMKEQEAATKSFIKASTEVAEKRKLLARTLNTSLPNTEVLSDSDKRRLKLLQKKYPFPGGSRSKRNKRAFKKHTSKRNRNRANKHTRKNKLNRKHSHTIKN
jgi:hypothetical protein